MDKKYRAGGATFSAAWLVVFGRELLTLDPEKTINVLGNFVSPISLYLGMVTLGVGGLSYFMWPIRKLLTKSGRFQLLAEEMKEVIRSHQNDVNSFGYDMSAVTAAKALELANRLRKFGIDAPKIGNGKEWYYWLPMVVGCATSGDFCKAKEITDGERKSR